VANGKDLRASSPTDFHVGDWLVQPSRNVIAQAGTVRHLEPQVMDLLVFLASAGSRVVSKDEIINAVWQGRFIAEATLTRAMADLRRVLGDDHRSHQYIETIPKRGYRLTVAVCSAAAGQVRVPRLPTAATETHAPLDSGRLLPVAAEETHDARGNIAACERIGNRLASMRRSRFVGRVAEMEMFRSALRDVELPFVVFHLSGAGGVGKTTLIHEFARVAEEMGRPAVRIDGRNIEPSEAGFLAALAQVIGAERVDLPAIMERWPSGAVLFIDTYEHLAALDDWLRQMLIPQLPAQTLIVIGGRDAPAAAWRTDVAWAALTRINCLGNLDRDETRDLLTKCGVAADHHDEAMAFTRGHPLALSLIADMLTRTERFAPSRLDTEPEIVRLLLETFVQKIPTRDHRVALHTCMTAWATTEALLATVLERSDVHDVFDWLARLPFIEHGPYGLFPHDLARDVVYMDFRWRDPDAAYRVTERVLGYLYERLDRTRHLDRQRVWFDILFVQRYNAALRAYFEWAGFGTAYAEPASEREHETILAMVERHEGLEAASIARYWLTRQPEAFHVIRHVDGSLLGFLANLNLATVTPDDTSADPAVARAMLYAEEHGPPRSGEQVLYGRFWMDAERHQAITQVFTVVAAMCSQSWIGPRVAWSFVAMADPDLTEPMFTEIHMWRVPEADFEVGGRRYGVFAHDWRVEPAREWLRLKAERASRIEGAISAGAKSRNQR
jgi:DNA-binding winged helix-turn-helix (wHTH) protein